MIHDMVVASETAAAITGKFDYGSVLHNDLKGENAGKSGTNPN